jgi:hypothetical protein
MLKLGDEALFSAPMLSHALALLEHEAGHIVPDVDSAEGRKEINKLSRAIGGAIKRLDERRATFVAELKRRPGEIDRVFRETFRVPAEEFKARVRRPLDEWDEAQREAEEETNRLLAELNAPVESGTASQAIAARLDATINLDLPDWLSESQRAALAAAMGNAITRLDAAHKAAVLAEEQARELERLRQVEREAELMRAREQAAATARAEAIAAADQRAREAAAQAEAELKRQERARLEAEQRARDAVANAQAQAAAAAQAERARIAAEQVREQAVLAERTADREHQATIHREIVADLCEIGYPELAAKALVSLIAKRRIVHLRIEY